MIELFQYQFFTNAIMASVLTAISCGIIGAYMVSRRMVFIGGGITHSSFGGIGIAYYLGFNPMLGAAIFAVLSAMGINFFTNKGKIREDSSIAIWWSLGMAIGIVFIALTPGYAPNLMSFLFGSILAVSHSDLIFMFALTTIVTLTFLLFYKPILIISFDEEFARARNLPVEFFNYLLMALTALVMVITIRVSGVILVLSLLTLPQATANLFTKKFGTLMLLSIALGFTGIMLGLVVAYYTDLPSGATIILIQTSLFFVAKILNSILRNKTKS
jgi:zinc transport system permease protein